MQRSKIIDSDHGPSSCTIRAIASPCSIADFRLPAMTVTAVPKGLFITPNCNITREQIPIFSIVPLCHKIRAQRSQICFTNDRTLSCTERATGSESHIWSGDPSMALCALPVNFFRGMRLNIFGTQVTVFFIIPLCCKIWAYSGKISFTSDRAPPRAEGTSIIESIGR